MTGLTSSSQRGGDTYGIDVAAEGNASMVIIDAIDYSRCIAMVPCYRTDIQTLL
jgi:hypothetical protein